MTLLSHSRLAILVPANPKQYGSGSEEKDRADINAHRLHAQLHGSVYWNVPASGRDHSWIDDVKTIYFAELRDQAPHRCDVVNYKGDIVNIEHFLTKDDMRSRFPAEEVELLCGTRRKVWELEGNGGYNWSRWTGVGKWGFLFFRIVNIRPLQMPLNIRDFAKAFGLSNEHVRRCQKYVIVFDPPFE